MALQGTLDTFALPDVLRLLAATKKTGFLRITGPNGCGGVVAVGDGAIGAIEVPHAPHVTDPADALFELLRFAEGSFTFEADAVEGSSACVGDLDDLLGQAESLLAEWREIESVVPSMDAWVTLRPSLVTPKVSIDRSQWQTIVAVGSGATVRHMSGELCLPELPVSRAVRDLVGLGLADIEPSAPAGRETSRAPCRAASVDPAPEAPLPTAPPLRARRVRAVAEAPAVPDDDAGRPDLADVAAAFPGLAAPGADVACPATPDEDEVMRKLAMLSPRAAEAVLAAANAPTPEERDAALDAAVEAEDQPINRGLLLKFLSSVKS